jgi:NAD(P)H-hydrate repair Nnr-like enzyme with NAD(P)H-hydrate epimerase domain
MNTESATLHCRTALLSAAQMARADRLTLASGISGNALMENAARPVAQSIMQRWTPQPVSVLCGPGNTAVYCDHKYQG